MENRQAVAEGFRPPSLPVPLPSMRGFSRDTLALWLTGLAVAAIPIVLLLTGHFPTYPHLREVTDRYFRIGMTIMGLAVGGYLVFMFAAWIVARFLDTVEQMRSHSKRRRKSD